MNLEQIKDTFSLYGYDHFFQQLKGPIELSGILDDAAEEELEDFFELFDLNDGERLFFDEFRYFYLLFMKIHPQLSY